MSHVNSFKGLKSSLLVLKKHVFIQNVYMNE